MKNVLNVVASFTPYLVFISFFLCIYVDNFWGWKKKVSNRDNMKKKFWCIINSNASMACFFPFFYSLAWHTDILVTKPNQTKNVLSILLSIVCCCFFYVAEIAAGLRIYFIYVYFFLFHTFSKSEIESI